MSGASNIEWCDVTWNAIRGCSRVSAGCMNCYAERQAIRQINTGYAGLIQRTSHGPAWTGEVRLVGSLLDPLHWRKPRRVFVNSMSDLFHENVPPHWLHQVFVVMAMCPQHTFIVLTKRPTQMRDYVAGVAADRWLQCRLVDHADLLVNYDDESAGAIIVARNHLRARQQRGDFRWPLPNVWLGVSVEDQDTADERIPLLLQTPAAMRFVSYEPALGPVDFRGKDAQSSALDRYESDPKLDWVIVGGESGPQARPCDVAWIRSTVEQCKAAGVACFVKQITERGRRVAFESWPADLRIREFPQP